MAAGRPTILAIDGPIRKVVEDATGGIFVHPGDVHSLVEAVRHLANNRSKAKEMGMAARHYLVKKFDRRHQAEAFMKLVSKYGKEFKKHDIS